MPQNDVRSRVPGSPSPRPAQEDIFRCGGGKFIIGVHQWQFVALPPKDGNQRSAANGPPHMMRHEQTGTSMECNGRTAIDGLSKTDCRGDGMKI